MRRAAAIILALAAAACSKPTELASEANAKGRITTKAAPAQTAAPEIPAEFLIEEPLPADPDAAPDAAVDPTANPGADPNAIIPLDRAVTVSDYRSSIAGEIGALPPVSDPLALATAFADWRSRAAASPGAMEDGAIPLGADPQEYRPSDAELVAAEAGDRLAAALSGADDATKAAVSTTLGGDPSYRRFDYRVVDVMGSGRYFYASSPKGASLPL